MIWGTLHKKWEHTGNSYAAYFQRRGDGLFSVWLVKNGKDMIHANKYGPLLQTLGETIEAAFAKMIQKLPIEIRPVDEIEKVGNKD